MEITKLQGLQGYKISSGDFSIWFDSVDIDNELDLTTLYRNGGLVCNLWHKTAIEFNNLWEEIK